MTISKLFRYRNMKHYWPRTHNSSGCKEVLSKIVRAVYKDGVLRLLEPVELKEGEEIFMRLERYEDRVKRLRKYRGILGKASREEIKELLLEAELERL